MENNYEGFTGFANRSKWTNKKLRTYGSTVNCG